MPERQWRQHPHRTCRKNFTHRVCEAERYGEAIAVNARVEIDLRKTKHIFADLDDIALPTRDLNR